MSRPLRIEFPGAWYHVMNRGAQRRTIFENDWDRRRFINLLADIHERMGVQTHAYALMGNHYHLLLHTPHGNLSPAMQYFGSRYVRDHNARHGTDGPMFRGRYKAIVVDSTEYLVQVSAYIHRNPLEAGLVEDLATYRWSSFASFVGLRSPEPWLFVGPTLNIVGGRQQYRDYVLHQAPDPEVQQFYNRQRLQPVLGGRAFKKRILDLGSDDVETDPCRNRAAEACPHDVIQAVVAGAFGVDTGELLRSGRGGSNLPRLVAIALGQRFGRSTLQELGERYGIATASGVSSAIRRLEQLTDSDQPTRSIVERLAASLTVDLTLARENEVA